MTLLDKLDRLFNTTQNEDQYKEAIAAIAKEIAETQINNNVKSSKDAMNCYLVYLWVYRKMHEVEDIPSRTVLKIVGELWKKESEWVKNAYRDISKKLKELIKGSTTYFIESKYSSQVERNAKNDYQPQNYSNIDPPS